MNKKILVAGGTGNLGGKIIHALLQKSADVRMIVRKGASKEKYAVFESRGVEIVEVDMENYEALVKACTDVDCVVSALNGLSDVIVDAQSALLHAAIEAKVRRFIPSDYSLNFTSLPYGNNRNFDLRRDFHKILDSANIAATSIFNGAFAEILTYNIPVFDYKKKICGYWGDDPDWLLDFTTMDNTAAFTAEAALDESTPRYLTVAGFRVRPKQLAETGAGITGEVFKVVPMGSLEEFAAYNKQQRAADPASEQEIFPRWQNGQYMHDMFSTVAGPLDNDRYSSIQWTTEEKFLKGFLQPAR